MDAALTDKPLCFIHLMKTAGASTRIFLESQFDHATILQAWNPQDFNNISKDKLAQYELFCGHIGGGQLDKFPKGTELFTIIRNPGRRLQSIHAWHRSLDKDYWEKGEMVAEKRNSSVTISKEGRSLSAHRLKLAKELDFFEYVSSNDNSLRSLLNNFTLRQLIGNGTNFSSLDDQDSDNIKGYDTALKILEDCTTVGVQENLTQSLELLCYERNWAAPSELPNIHSTGGKKQITQEEENIIKSRNKIDYEIYNKYSERFQEDYSKLAEEAGGIKNIRQYLNDRHRETVFSRLIEKEELELTANLAWPGIGWGLREFNHNNQYWRWIGQTGSASVLVRLKPNRQYYLKIYFHHINISKKINLSDGISITGNSINMSNLKKGFENNYYVIGGLLEETHLRNDGLTEIAITLSKGMIIEDGSAAVSRILIAPYS